jgi:probable F420-dependent oxidoreductase
MRFSVQLPTDKVEEGDEFVSGAAVAEMACCAEDAGFDACFVTDHPFPGDRWLAAGGHHSLDPFVALSFAAATTTRLRLQTNVLVLAYRNPFLVAKAAASLDVLSGGRVVLGVAAGYLKSEFGALGVDFAERNDLADEALQAMRLAWTEEGVAFEGRHFEARGNSMLPRPLQSPHPPVWVGGNSRRAIRRAVQWGDGWCPFPTQPGSSGHVRTARLENWQDLEERLDYLREQVTSLDRKRPLDICFMPFGMDMFAKQAPSNDQVRETVERLEGLGVTWVPMAIPARSRAEFCDRLRQVGDELLAKLR